jgi:hypothetical protein
MNCCCIIAISNEADGGLLFIPSAELSVHIY